jgi:hypothetical protein
MRLSSSSRIRRTSSSGRPAGVERPVLVALARAERAGIAAAHRDHDVGRLHDLVRERLGEVRAACCGDSRRSLVRDVRGMPCKPAVVCALAGNTTC